MTEFIRTPEKNFDVVEDFSYPPRYHAWQDLRMHYVDTGPSDGPVMLLLHGMPTWSYLYRKMIPLLVDAGFRCIAPDHLGFGRSDKPTDLHWYTIARHTEVLTSLITDLDLQQVTLVCQDWGGPTGLAQAVMMPTRFERLVIMNTWLHHDGFVYARGTTSWIRHWNEGGLFCRPKPNVAPLLAFANGHITREQMIQAIAADDAPKLSGEAANTYAAYAAPFSGLDDAAHNGLRRFPLSIPVDNPSNGNAAAQAHHYQTLLDWKKPAHFIWGIEDDGFTETWGRTWSERMGGTFDRIVGAGHFLQESHGAVVAETLLQRIG